MSGQPVAQVRIFGTVISTYTRIVQITCEEAGLTHETIATAANSPANRHPFSKVPVVEVDGLELIESVAIAAYLDNAHNGSTLQPADPAARAVMDKWIALANNYLFPIFEHGLVMPWIMHRVAGFPLERERIERSLPGVSRALGFLEAELSQDGAWTACSQERGGFTLADVFLYPIIRSLQLTPQGEVGIGQCDHLAAWLDACRKRPSIVATQWESEP
ncbi:glutathione S-transferase family protein [uncultured Erythrobacter sp.]|uniref:glutathione S-transferase family protein n=1 Tax=uncultured Erythrobacter sp. TaxID=263913 RepID=UPI0026356996|nr:glutathione S-transferase family protein [uncultured Erythrobacter sp.]